MKSKIWLINTVLVLCLMLMGMNAWQVWTGEMPEQQMPEKKEVPEPSPQIRAGTDRHVPESRYTVIAEKNLFDPERKEDLPEEAEKAADSGKQENIPRQNLLLHGVVLMRDYRKALVQTSGTGAGQKENRWVKTGDEIASLKVSAIQKESIIVSDGAKEYEILLYDGKSRGKTVSPAQSSSAPNIIHAGGEEKAENVKADAVKADASGKDSGKTAENQKAENRKAENQGDPVFGGIDRNKGNHTPAPAAEKKESSPVFGGRGKNDPGKSEKESGNAKQNPVINPFLQLLQKNSGDQQ